MDTYSISKTQMVIRILFYAIHKIIIVLWYDLQRLSEDKGRYQKLSFITRRSFLTAAPLNQYKE